MLRYNDREFQTHPCVCFFPLYLFTPLRRPFFDTGGDYRRQLIAPDPIIAPLLYLKLMTHLSDGVGGNARRQISQGREGHRGAGVSNPVPWRPALT
jgi:hypothetical protein